MPVPVADAAQFGTIEIDNSWRITGFHAKVALPPEIPDRPGWVLASMGNYVFDTGLLCDALRTNASEEGTKHDFGTDILPKLVRSNRIFAYDFHSNRVPREAEPTAGYWRDVGTIDAYHEANMDLRSAVPRLDMYNEEWPVHTAYSAPS